MNNGKVSMSQVLDACEMVEGLPEMDSIEAMRARAQFAVALLDQVMGGSEKIEKNHCSVD